MNCLNGMYYMKWKSNSGCLGETVLVTHESHDVLDQGKYWEASLDDRCYLHRAYATLEYSRIPKEERESKDESPEGAWCPRCQ